MHHQHHQGKYIAVQRFKQGYKQWQFAKLIDVSPSRMSVIEQTAELEEPTLQKIATALKLPVHEIKGEQKIEGGGGTDDYP